MEAAGTLGESNIKVFQNLDNVLLHNASTHNKRIFFITTEILIHEVTYIVKIFFLKNNDKYV